MWVKNRMLTANELVFSGACLDGLFHLGFGVSNVHALEVKIDSRTMRMTFTIVY